jgi:hypothetical protein
MNSQIYSILKELSSGWENEEIVFDGITFNAGLKEAMK